MSFEKFLTHRKAIIITLDDALYPKKDYLLQVYYLFSEFIEYAEQINSKMILAFMNAEYLAFGEEDLFQKTSAKFNIPAKYQHNFELLHQTAILPLKLLLFKQVLSFLEEAVAQEKLLFILADGNPAVAINKIKQIEWNNLQPHLKVYFTAEYQNSKELAIKDLLQQQGLVEGEVVLFASENQFENNFVNLKVDSFSVTQIL